MSKKLKMEKYKNDFANLNAGLTQNATSALMLDSWIADYFDGEEPQNDKELAIHLLAQCLVEESRAIYQDFEALYEDLFGEEPAHIFYSPDVLNPDPGFRKYLIMQFEKTLQHYRESD